MNTFLSLIAAVFLTVEVSNPANEYREQVVEIPLSDVLQTLGIPGFRAVKAEGLDLEDADIGAILAEAAAEAEAAADWLARQLKHMNGERL